MVDPSSGGGGGPLRHSPEELRRRRLATLERISATNTSPAPPASPRMMPMGSTSTEMNGEKMPRPASSPKATSAAQQRVQIQNTPIYVDDVGGDDDDAALQAALALSLKEAGRQQDQEQQNNHAEEKNKGKMVEDGDDIDETDQDLQAALSLSLQRDDDKAGGVGNGIAAAAFNSSKPVIESNIDGEEGANGAQSNNIVSRNIVKNLSGLSLVVAESYKTSEPSDVLEFHSVMWDSGITTDNDKQRWLGQGINFRDFDPEGKLKDTVPFGSQDSLFAAIINNHGPWGLTQTHGGPCGVLAAIQAELLRLLLFGERNPLQYPSVPRSTPARTKPDLSERLLNQGLAMSIALILARAAISPPVSEDETQNSYNNLDNTLNHASTSTVQIVLPIHPHALAWDDFEPWTSMPPEGGDGVANFSKSATLRTYSITTPNTDPSSPKRQKTDETSHVSLDERIVRLAHAVTQFLLEAPEASEAPLEAFRRPGGVVLLVMSLAFSRGPRLVQGDMDDPSAKLTSQFGHCGQELINLLLTGQAVSNVFDNTLTPSGDLVCRGIQARPPVGYLTQLESMRYLEVGGYYKTPRFPIWVVGSMSHFTVMFGGAECLKESQSDALLERCRRAFKAIDGGEENGFIPTQALGGFLQSLELDIPDHGVQMLAATIEVHGAGIILWDDLWKHTSRLMTGASLEAVLQFTDTQETKDDGPPPLLLTQFGETEEMDKKPSAVGRSAEVDGIGMDHIIETDEEMAKRLAAELDGESTTLASSSATAASSSGLDPTSDLTHSTAGAAAAVGSPMDLESPPLSDEELARKLQEEWDAEVSGAGTSTANSVTAVRGSPTPSSWSNLADDMNLSGFGNATQDPLMSGGSASGNATTATTSSTTASNISSSNNTNASVNNQNNNVTNPAAKQDYERPDRTFQLYHYNGLRGGNLRPFRVTRLSPEEAVGASISLMGNNPSSAAHNGNGDLEDVIRTKWPSCIINWFGGPPPSID